VADARQSVCPYCARPFEAMPSRKLKCPGCGNVVHVKTRPSDRQLILLTDDGARQAVEEWAQQRIERLWSKVRETQPDHPTTTLASGIRFGVVNEYAVRAVATHSGESIREWGSLSETTFREIMLAKLRVGLRNDEARALLIAGGLGLARGQLVDLERFQKRLERQLEPRITPAKIEAQRKKLADRLLRDRAETILRTESIRAQVAGKFARWDEAARRGLFDPAKARLRWMATIDGREDDVCRELDGKTTPYGQPFSVLDPVNGLRLTFNGPPAHPNCRCTLSLLP
jgi:SPP1 gp7 family putative phage head morphogenesis protein